MLLRKILWRALLAFAFAIPNRASGATMNDPGAFSVEAATLKTTRRISKRAKAEVRNASKPVRIAADWEIRPSADDTLTDCLYHASEKVYCRYGRLSGGYESLDRTHVLVYSAGASIDPRHDKGIFIFEVSTRRLVKEVSFKSGGPMIASARPNADLLAVSYQDGQDLVLEAYNFRGDLHWQKRFAASRSPGHLNLGVSEDGSRILLGSIPVRISRESQGRVQVLSRNGDVLQEIPAAQPRLMLNRRGSLAVIWNTSGYMLYPFKEQRIILRRECEDPESEYCLVRDISEDGRFVAAVTVKRAPRPDEMERIARVELVDVEAKRVHTDSVDVPARASIMGHFSKDNSLTISTEAEDVEYETIR